MLGFKISALLVLIALTTRGQVVNNLSSDRGNMYFHALDSAVRILKETAVFDLVMVLGDRSVIDKFPDSVDGIKLVKVDDSQKKVSKIKKGEAMLVVRQVQIIRDEFKIPIIARGQDGPLGDGFYTFRYKYIPETMTYRLMAVKRGFVL
jgi:hypothetical protein